MDMSKPFPIRGEGKGEGKGKGKGKEEEEGEEERGRNAPDLFHISSFNTPITPVANIHNTQRSTTRARSIGRMLVVFFSPT